MHALLIAETTPKLLRLSGLARSIATDLHWKAVTTGAFSVQIDRFDVRTGRPRIKMTNRLQLNRIVTMAADADTVFVATDTTPRGDLLAADLAEHLLSRYPERHIKRLRIDRLTAESFRSAYAVSDHINVGSAESLRVGRIINFLVGSRVQQLTGKPSGRAVLPMLARLVSASRPGQSRIRVRLTDGTCLTSQFGPTERVAQVFAQVRESIPALDIKRSETILSPPQRFSLARLQLEGCRIAAIRSSEVARQATLLYEAGLIARNSTIEPQYIDAAHEILRSFDGVPSIDNSPTEPAIVPTDIERLPSTVERHARDVYRIVWATTVASFAKPMRSHVEQGRFEIDRLRFDTTAVTPLEPGFDAVAFGLLYRRGPIGTVRQVESAQMFGGGPFETELLAMLSPQLYSPAHVIKAAHNLAYLGFDGPEVVLLEHGNTTFDQLICQAPQLLDVDLFDSIERFLASSFDSRELLEPWSRWAGSVTDAVRKKRVAYLR